MMFVGDGVMELKSVAAEKGDGVAAGVVAWPEQATRIMSVGKSTKIGSLVIRVLLSF